MNEPTFTPASAPGFAPVGRIEVPRDDFWGFDIGDRVMVAEDGAHHGLLGKIVWIGGCSIAATSESCSRVCSNVGFAATHRILGDGTLQSVTPGMITVPPAHLEHCD